MTNIEPIVQPLSFYEAMSDDDLKEELEKIQRDAQDVYRRMEKNRNARHPSADLAMQLHGNLEALNINCRYAERALRRRS